MDTFVKILATMEGKDLNETKLTLEASVKVANTAVFRVDKKPEIGVITSGTELPYFYSEFGVITDSIFENDMNFAIVRVNTAWYHILSEVLSNNKTLELRFTKSLFSEMHVSPWEIYLSIDTPTIKPELYTPKPEFIHIDFLQSGKPTINGNLYPEELIKNMVKQTEEKSMFLTIDGYADGNYADVGITKFETIAGKVIGTTDDNKFKVQIIGPMAEKMKNLIKLKAPMMMMPRGVGEIKPRTDGEKGSVIQTKGFKLVCFDLIYNEKDIPGWLEFNPIETITMLS